MEDDPELTVFRNGLTRNPLGVIALFITLVQSFATLLLGFGGDRLHSHEKAPLIWFVVLFPFLVLWVFFRLVTEYHGNLYSPSEYRSDQAFFSKLPQELQDARLDEDVESIVPVDQIDVVEVATQHRALGEDESGERRRRFELIREKYKLAQSLAIKRVEMESGLKFERQASFDQRRTTAFDGIAQDGDTFTAVEVQLLSRPLLSSPQLQAILYRALLASTLISKRSEKAVFRLILAFVLEFDENIGIEPFVRRVRRTIEDAPFPVSLHVFSFSNLKNEFGSDLN